MLRTILFTMCLVAMVMSAMPRNRRQSCECTAGEAPKCGCQVLPSSDPSKNVQMVCSCTPPVAPKCTCKEAQTLPPLPMPPTQQYKCTDVCQTSCLESCSRLQHNNNCNDVCSDACQFSCNKQVQGNSITKAKDNSGVSEYKFIIPESRSNIQALQTLATPRIIIQTPTPTPPPIVVVSSTPAPKQCDVPCQPDCSFACTTLKPALKLLSQFMDSRASYGECQKACGETCLRVCHSSGIGTSDCSINCTPACGETCGFVRNGRCTPACMPTCSNQCLQTELMIQLSPLPPPAPVSPVPLPIAPPAPRLFVSSTPVPMPFPQIISFTSTAPPTPAPEPLRSLCQNECSVQCEHQCGVHSLSGPQCLAACQTTCYPVCQAKFRRRHMKEPSRREE